MKQYECDLRTALAEYRKEPRQMLVAGDIGLDYARAEMLEARGLIADTFKDMAGNYAFRLSPKGLTYFDDKKAARRDFWKRYVLNFFGGLAVGVIGTLLATYFTGCLRF